MIHLITACDNKYTESAEHLVFTASKHGAEKTHVYRLESLPVLFLQLIGSNIKETDRPMFYIWKPYVIWDYMRSLPDGDILIYCDAGTTVTDSILPLVREDEDVILYHNPWKHVEWCKMDVMEAINGAEWGGEDYGGMCYGYNQNKQTQASFMIFRVNETTRNFVKEWMLYCLMPGFCDNSPSKLPNYPSFQEHRYDQAVLCCLAIKYGYKMQEIPRIDNGNAEYRCLDHHRKSNAQW